MRLIAAALTLALVPRVAGAQAYSCPVPQTISRPRPDLPNESNPARRMPIGSYTLAVSWTPQFCRTRGGAGRSGGDSEFQCSSGSFGWTLHGLWPDGIGDTWPQYCRATPLLARRTIARNLCATPSAQLLQHEWAKHGTCMAGYTPDRYFATSTALYRKLRWPDMDALSRRERLSSSDVAEAVAGANPGLRADAIRVTTTRDGWLDELWLCLDRRMRYARCEHGGGVAPGTSVSIWRARR